MISLAFGHCDIEIADLLLETDLGSPVHGPPGLVSLSVNSVVLLQYFIGYSSPKHNTKKYLYAVHQCYHRFRSEFNHRKLTVHCHNWKSGIGRVLISDIIRITQPSNIIEYFDKNAQIEMIIAEKTSFLDGVYHKSPAKLSAVQLSEQKPSDFKAIRSKLLAKYLAIEGNVPMALAAASPQVCFASEIAVKLNGSTMSPLFFKAIVGKIAGLCEKNSEICHGIGVIRDFNEESGMIYVVTPVADLGQVDCLEIFNDDGCITLEKNDIWSEELVNNVEIDVAGIVTGAILLDKIQKYHPSRNFTK